MAANTQKLIKVSSLSVSVNVYTSHRPARCACRRLFRKRLVSLKGRPSTQSERVERRSSRKLCVCPKFFLLHVSAIPQMTASHRNKAVSDGAVSFYLDKRVKTRIAKVAYGPIYNTIYDQKNPEHRQRESKIVTSRDGTKRIPDRFNPILPKVGASLTAGSGVWKLMQRVHILRIPRYPRSKNSPSISTERLARRAV